MNLRRTSKLRWAMLAILCLGLSGLAGCSRGYHTQHSGSIGSGGRIGKGSRGKSKFAETREAGGVFGENSGAKSDPFAGLTDSNRPRTQVKKPRPQVAAGARSPKPRKVQGVFGSGSSSERRRAGDPFKDF